MSHRGDLRKIIKRPSGHRIQPKIFAKLLV
jgi:hypothetical protein